MIVSPRIVAIDDNVDHLRALVSGLSRTGTVCLPVHFPEEAAEVAKCPSVRIIFADLHLDNSSASGEVERHFGTIASLLTERFVPRGPYLIILWTMYAEHAESLFKYLRERSIDIPPPVKVLALDKSQHMEANQLKDPTTFVREVRRLIASESQLACLLDWEERVLGAASETVSEIVKLASGSQTTMDSEKLKQILYYLGIEAVGERNLGPDRFRSVNESLLPILADRLSALKADPAMSSAWATAFPAEKQASLSSADAASLNKYSHIDDSDKNLKASARGAVSVVGDQYEYFWFGKTAQNGEERNLDFKDLAQKEFLCKIDPINTARWMLIQIQASCDYAQAKSGTVPLALALEMPVSAKLKSTPPAALWLSPIYKLDGDEKQLVVNCRYQIWLPKVCINERTAVYRLRDSLLIELAHHIHNYGGRPGKISFSVR